MRIGIDARFFGSLGKGLGRYSQKLIENLERIDNKNQYFIFLCQKNFDEYQPKNPNFKKVLADFKWYSFEEQFFFPKLLKKFKLDLVHFPHFNIPIFYKGKFIVTIHDLILLHFSTIRSTTLNPFFYKIKFWIYKKVINKALHKSEKIITVSNFTKDDILKEFPKIKESKIFITYEAAENFCFFSQKKAPEILEKYGIIKPYLLYIGNAYPHKNLERLVLAFEKIKKDFPEVSLVLVGKEDYFYSCLKQFINEKNITGIIFPGFVLDEELDLVLRKARAYVWPSLYEGFGLPPLEAMTKGTPIVSSSHSCMKEILGESVLYFDGKNIDDIYQKVSKLLKNNVLKEELIEKGYQQSRKYSWHRMAQETLKIYNEKQK